MKGKTVNIKPDSTLVVVLDSPLQEPQPDPFLTEFLHAKIYSIYDLITALDRAAKDDRIKSVLARRRQLPARASARSRRSATRSSDSRPARSPSGPTSNSRATAATTCAAPPTRSTPPPARNLLLIGLAAEVPFYRGILDKVKVEPQLYHVGKYKSYSDTFMLKEMSEAQREATDAHPGQPLRADGPGGGPGTAAQRGPGPAAIDAGFLWGDEFRSAASWTTSGTRTRWRTA